MILSINNFRCDTYTVVMFLNYVLLEINAKLHIDTII